MGTAQKTSAQALSLHVSRAMTAGKVKSVALTAATPHPVTAILQMGAYSVLTTAAAACVSKTSVQMWNVFPLRLPATEIGPYPEPSLPVTLTLESVFTQPEPLPKIVEAWG